MNRSRNDGNNIPAYSSYLSSLNEGVGGAVSHSGNIYLLIYILYMLSQEDKKLADEAVAESTPVVSSTGDSDRGKIINPNFSTQVIDYSGLRYDKITPTDLDGFMDFGDNHFVFLEYKYKDGAMPYGQKLALERLVDCVYKFGKKAILIVASHNDSGDIDGAAARVRAYRFEEKWYLSDKYTVKQLIDKFISS